VKSARSHLAFESLAARIRHDVGILPAALGRDGPPVGRSRIYSRIPSTMFSHCAILRVDLRGASSTKFKRNWKKKEFGFGYRAWA